MKDKEMIEKLANLIYDSKPIKEIWIEDAEAIAKTLYSAGYRKIDKDSILLSKTDFDLILPDNSVVLSREEYDKLKDQANIKCDVENIREAVFDATSCVIGYKEAEKIYQRCFPDNPEQFVKERKPSYNDGYFDGSKETAEQFIKECKKYKFKKFSPISIGQRETGVSWIEMPEWKLEEFAKRFGCEIKE